MADVNITAANAVISSVINVTFDVEPLHTSSSGSHDALNPASWTITRLDSMATLTILSIASVTTTNFNVTFSETLVAGVQYEVEARVNPSTAATSGSLAGLSWQLPCLGPHTSNHCPMSPTSTSSANLVGTAGHTYDIELSFKGVVEKKVYTGGTNDGAFFQIGGSPGGSTFNYYSLAIGGNTYYLNRGTSEPAAVFGIDYTKTFTSVPEGTLFSLVANSGGDNIGIWNNFGGSPVSVTGVTIVSQPFDGQFIQMDVISVTDTTTPTPSTFDFYALAAVDLLSPDNDAVDVDASTSIVHDWTDADAATSYEVVISVNSDLTSPVYDNTGSVSNFSASLDHGTKYYWQVTASDGVNSVDSEEWSYTTDMPAPTLTYPSDGATTVPVTLTLTWDTIDGATSYEVQVATDSLFTSPVVDDVVSVGSKFVPSLDSLTTYYWRVQATGPDVTGPWSDTFSFTTLNLFPGDTSKTHFLFIPSSETSKSGGLNDVKKVASVIDETTFTFADNRPGTTLSPKAKVIPMAAPESDIKGPYIFDPLSGPAVTFIDGKTTEELGIGEQYNIINLDISTNATPALDFPDENGWILIGFGTEYQVGPIQYLGRFSDTALRLDFTFKFPKTIPIGTEVTLLAQKGPYAPRSIKGSFYLTASPGGRVAASDFLDQALASGQEVNKVVSYPGDRGLGAEGQPAYGNYKLSDKVRVWSGDDEEGEVESNRAADEISGAETDYTNTETDE